MDFDHCGACGFALGVAKATERVDALLEDLLDLPAVASVAEAPARPEEEPEVDQKVAEQLFDSLLVEIQPSGTAAESDVLSGSTAPIEPDRVAQEIAAVEKVPIVATPGDTEGRKLTHISGRMVDIVTFGSILGLLVVFIGFRMYANFFDSSNHLPIGIFAGVALAGMGASLALFHVSNSEVAQGDRLVKAGRYQEAINHYERAIRLVRRPSYAWTSRGVAMKYLGRLDDAFRCHENAIRLDPENEVAWCNLGTVYFKKGEFGKALECYDKAIKIRPRYAIAWNNKGVVLARINRFPEADKCHEKATRLRPEYVAAWLNRGEVLARLGAREEAQACLERAQSLSRSASG